MTRLSKKLLAAASALAIVGAPLALEAQFVPITLAQISDMSASVITAAKLATNATGGLVTNPGAWQSWSPTVTCTTQTGTVFNPSGTYYEGPGRVVHVQEKVALTSFNTCASNMLTTLPVTPAAGSTEAMCWGRENGTTGVSGFVYWNGSTALFVVTAGTAWLATASSNVFDLKCMYQGAT